MKKAAYLLLALLVPGLIFVFLKYAGSNRFDITVLPEEGTPLHSDCQGAVTGTYVAPDSVWSFVQDKDKPAHVVVFSEPKLAADRIAAEITEEVGGDVTFTMDTSLASDSTARLRWKSCVFLLQSPRQTVLLDNSGRIRGQYDLRSREETDRLRVEIKILAEKY